MFHYAQNVDASHSTFTELHPGSTLVNITNVTEPEASSSAWWRLVKANIEGAAYNSCERDPAHRCLENTRREVFKSINKILDNPDPCICWLSGLAGTGKSSIAYTLSDRLDKEGKLVASFVFSQKQVERSRTDGFFPSIAYQLAVAFPSAKSMIVKTLEDDPSILRKILRDQCDKLLIEPLLSLTAEQRWTLPKVIVVDSLDECQGDGEVEQLVRLLVDRLRDSRLPPLKLFLTSRPEEHIRIIFLNQDIKSFTRPLLLDAFEVDKDIHLYLRHSFNKIIRKASPSRILDDSQTVWPSEQDLSTLVAKADGLFIYASTVMKFIGDEGNPRNNLTELLKEKGSFVTYHDLDQLYHHIISSPNAKYGMKLTAIIVHLAAPLSLRDLQHLLPWQPGDMEVALRAFSSVFFVPKNDDDQIRIYHTSFCDFLVDSKRSTIYPLDVSACHRDIATFCLDFLVRTLRRNICHIEDPSKLNDEVEGLGTRCRENINTALSYCCRYWATHISNATMDGRLQTSLTSFMEKSLLY